MSGDPTHPLPEDSIRPLEEGIPLRMAAEHGEAEMCFARLTSKDGTETAVNLDLVELMKADGTGTRLFFPGSEDGLFVRESTADILERVSSHVV